MINIPEWIKCDRKECPNVAWIVMENPMFDVHVNVCTMHYEELRKENCRIYAVEQAINSHPLQQIKFERDEKIAVIFGNEVTGVEQSTIELTDGCIEIPQMGMKHSLNIATAVGVVLWEMVRTRIETV